MRPTRNVPDIKHFNSIKSVNRFTFGGLLLGAAAVVAAHAGVERTAEALVVEHGERVEADTRLVVELPAVRDVAAAHGPLRLLTLETRVDS